MNSNDLIDPIPAGDAPLGPTVRPLSRSVRIAKPGRGFRRARRGAIAVEFAMVVPILFLLFFGAFEFCRVAMIRHTVDNAVYEAVRRGVVPGASSSDVRAQAERVLSTIGLSSFNINVAPSNIQDETDEVTVTIDVPLDENTFVPATYFVGKQLRRELTMRREGR